MSSLFQQLEGLSDDALGETLVQLVKRTLLRGRPPTVVAITRPDRVDLVGLRSVVEQRVPVETFVASLTRAIITPEVHAPVAVGLIGAVDVRANEGPPVPMVLVFLEWTDCRWWHWKALLDPETGQLREDTETLHAATRGDPLPNGLGRWWSVGRQLRQVRIDPWPLAPVPPDEMVH